ncbi:MAG: PAS domain-containing protein [Gammaproteobacteria bacterium]|nr:PAS domain-containing protein [Gammaproteobacteria bacterium]
MKHSSGSAVGSSQWLIGTFVLSALALAGYYFSITIFFGASFVFGAIAAILAVALYGSVSAVIVVLIGSAYTIILFNHPYAMLVFTLEVVSVSLLYRKGMRNLVLSDLLFWCTLGPVVVLLIYHNVIGLSWTASQLIFFKQFLNGVFNALIASIILLLISIFPLAFLPHKQAKPTTQNILFIPMLTTILLISIVPSVFYSDSMQSDKEAILAQRLADKAFDIEQSINDGTHTALQRIINLEYFSDGMGVAIVGKDEQVLASRGLIVSLKKSGEVRLRADNFAIWLPSGEMPAMMRWKQGTYVLTFPLEEHAYASKILIEYSASSMVDSIEALNLDLFRLVTIFILLSIIVVQAIAYWFARPINKLAATGRGLAADISSGTEIVFPVSPIQEVESLSSSLQIMSANLGEIINELHCAKDGLEAQVKKRTKELEFVNSSLKDRQFALDQHAIVSITDAAGTIIFANEKFCEISGYTYEEVVGKNHRLIKSSQHKASFYANLWTIISQGKTWSGEICNRRKDGSLYWVQSTITSFLDSTGKPFQYIAIRTDITHVKQAESELREKEQRMSLAIEGAGDGIWDWNIIKGSMSFSRLYEQMLGYNEHELKPLPSSWESRVFVDDLAPTQAIIQRYLSGEIPDYIAEYRMRCKDGSYKWIMCRGKLVARTQAGLPERMIGIHTDISERKESEQVLVSAREEADRANRAKSEFLSSMSHELRTPMNAILGFAQLLEMDQDLNEHQLESVSDIMKGGEHLLALINEVLDLAKIESGNIDLSLEPVELKGIIAECFELMLPLAVNRNITIEHSEFKGEVIRADRTRLKQSLINLLSNAIKYNKENGSVLVDVETAENNQIRIKITDTGYGIAEDKIKDLFEPFNRLEADKSGVEGTGIGLTITRRIIELMGGVIGVNSEAGIGSTFWIELPLESVSVAIAKAERKQDAAEQKVVVQRQSTVLYIDDNPVNLKLVSKVLASKKHIHLLTAHTPVLGLELADEHVPELILLDINMPGMNGYEVLAELKKDSRFKDTPFLALSADAMPKDIERGLAAGFNEYLIKPLDFKKFNLTITHYLSSPE